MVKTDPTRLYDKLTKKFTADHSDLPWAKGGGTTEENGKLETVEYNNEKSDKVNA